MIISADGTKVPVGLMLADPENHHVADLLADLVACGLRYSHGIVAELEGSKALREAVAKMFGETGAGATLHLHKRHPPDEVSLPSTGDASPRSMLGDDIGGRLEWARRREL